MGSLGYSSSHGLQGVPNRIANFLPRGSAACLSPKAASGVWRQVTPVESVDNLGKISKRKTSQDLGCFSHLQTFPMNKKS